MGDNTLIKRGCLAVMMFLMLVSTMLGNAESPYSVDFDLRNMAGFNDNVITAEDIVAYIQENYPTSPLLVEDGIGDCFISAGESNNVNPAFLVATAELENLFGIQGWAKSYPECHNTFGWAITDEGPVGGCCADSWCAMIHRVSYNIALGDYYYSQNRFTVSQVREQYATKPNTETIVRYMNDLYTFSINRQTKGLDVPAVDVLSIGFLEESQAISQVTLTLYVHDGSASGPIIQGAQVTGRDGSGSSFEQTTDSNGYVTITGYPGTWSFSASADGYETNNWDQEITETGTKDAFLQKEQPVIRTNEYIDNSTAISCAPGSKRPTCPSAYYCVDCSGKCIPPGADVGRGWSCDQGKWNYNPSSLADLGTYHTNLQSVQYDSETSMIIANVRYEMGVQAYFFYNYIDYYADFNLNKAYSRLTGSVGLDDKTVLTDNNVTVVFEGDDKPLQTFELYLGDFPADVDIDVCGVRKLTIKVMPRKKVGNAYVDLINMNLIK